MRSNAPAFFRLSSKKRIFIIILILVLTGFIFRQALYCSFIKYQPIEKRTEYIISEPELITLCEIKGTSEKNSTIGDIIHSSSRITSGQLKFTFAKAETDPNKLINTGKANCIGYAAFFAAVCNYQFVNHKLANIWKATPYKGKLYLLGINLHQYIQSPFFKDHDFVIIKNKNTGETYAVDPSVNDYLGIDFVALKSE